MIPAANITLCCIDTEHHALSAVALRRCSQLMAFGRVVVLTDRPDHVDPGWDMHRIRRFESYAEFNRFTLKGLYYHIETEYALVVQFDGFITDPGAWTDEFLAYDYVGAPWWHFPGKPYQVGNGGFSLRSRKLLKALQDDRITLPADAGAEDLCICQTHRSYLECQYGIRFAPVELAARFSYESGPYVAGTFGFHGLRRLVDLYVGDMAGYLADNLSGYLLRKGEAVVLALQYAFREQHREAAMLFKRIAQHQSFQEARAYIVTNGPPDIVQVLDEAWPRYVT